MPLFRFVRLFYLLKGQNSLQKTELKEGLSIKKGEKKGIGIRMLVTMWHIHGKSNILPRQMIAAIA